MSSLHASVTFETTQSEQRMEPERAVERQREGGSNIGRISKQQEH